MRGEPVTVIQRTQAGKDPGGDIIWQTTETLVDNVLVADGRQSNIFDSIRPDGVTVAKTLYFPRSWAYSPLRGTLIRIDGIEYEVVGDPRPYDGGVKPTAWNLTVEVTDTRG